MGCFSVDCQFICWVHYLLRRVSCIDCWKLLLAANLLLLFYLCECRRFVSFDCSLPVSR